MIRRHSTKLKEPYLLIIGSVLDRRETKQDGVRRALSRLDRELSMPRWFSRLSVLFELLRHGGVSPRLCPAIASGSCTAPHISNRSYGIDDLLNDFRIVLGVPKYRTSKPKKQTRKFSNDKLYSLKMNLVACQNCGEYHELHTLCGKCYEKVRKMTNEIKAKMMNYNPYKGERQDKEVHLRFADDADEVVDGRRIIEIEVPRPTWFKKKFSS